MPPALAWRTQFALDYQGEINVDLFAGGGGASTGLEMGLQRPVHVAINHDPDAISMHQANHPGAVHYLSDVYEVDPIEAAAGRPIGWLHASPDCTHHSQARGGQPRKRVIRSLSWVVHKWAGLVRPRVISLENVEQILQWSPLIAKRCPKTGRVITVDTVVCPETGRKTHRVADPGERVPVQEQFLVPDRRRRGHNWRHFVEGLRRLGYRVEWRTLRACDFGAPTTRERLFLVARCDGQPIAWPKPTHHKHPKRGQKRWRSAAECIDWSIPGRSIFDRPRPLAENTLRRIAKGIQKFVIDAAEPFIVPIANYGRGEVVHSTDEPLRSITAWPRGGAFALCTAYMAQMNGGFNESPGRDLREPLSTIAARGSQQQLVECRLSPDDQVGALRVAAFLISYYGKGGPRDLREPMDTLTTRDRLALVTVTIQGTHYVIVDIALRMLKPRELYRAQGFPDSYIIDRGHDGRRFTATAQTRMCGNSVSPLPMAATAAANDHQVIAAHCAGGAA
ncbi:DNA cytosine methyltransferase [Halomonas sp. EGI 63088]|uniref:DNA (cytosine-5-)-methyltransferase n=1 Tax=Halomonas flagellata TaxID=2920385 RepID=A0ABS9RUA5_9GAMM|nr:DNA cytosine methyltransferase [Halomonas flagellata]MCH4563384.1 DNA cytosine methyltransferase [Halomonas flagellata]